MDVIKMIPILNEMNTFQLIVFFITATVCIYLGLRQMLGKEEVKRKIKKIFKVLCWSSVSIIAISVTLHLTDTVDVIKLAEVVTKWA